jgi:hypothetical protein
MTQNLIFQTAKRYARRDSRNPRRVVTRRAAEEECAMALSLLTHLLRLEQLTLYTTPTFSQLAMCY